MIWYGIKGFRNSFYGERWVGVIIVIKMCVLVLGGNFGVWGGFFFIYDCVVKGVRKKEDLWNVIVCFLWNFEVGSRLLI